MSEKINEKNSVQWCWASLGKAVLSVVLLMPLITVADTWTDKDYHTWEYTVSGGKATITKYKNSPSGIVSIPEKINGIPVVKVDDYAYSNKKSFTGLIIPDCITEIGLSAFENCTALADVVIGSHLTNVTETSFWGCKAIRSVKFKSIPSIKKANIVTGDWILETREPILKSILQSMDETSRNEVYLCPRVGPYGKAKLQWQNIVTGNSAHEFLEWKWSDNANSYARIGWYVDGVKTTSILGTGSDGWNYYNVSIPNGVHLISCEYSMEGNQTGGNDAWVRVPLVKVKFLDKTVKSIFPSAYEHIERVSLGTGVNTPSGFFNDCTNLTRVEAESIKEWLGHSFSVAASSPLQNGAKLYVDGKLLTNLVIPDGVTRIGAYAFLNCTSITNVVFPRSVVSIYTSAFKGCENVKSTTIRSDGFQLDLVFPDAYRKLESVAIQEGSEYIGSKFAYGCEALKRLEVKDELASIGSSAFYGCSSLACITIPPKIKSVGPGAFGGCLTLTRVDIESLSTWLEIDFEDFEANPLSAGGDLIVNGDKVTSITFPQGVAEVRRNVFSGCSSLSNVVFSADVSTVLGSAFVGCRNVKNVGFMALPKVPTIKNVSGNWIVAPEQIDGSVVCRSPAIGNSAETSMQATLTGPQNYSFRWAVSSEDQYDFLIWSLDGKEMGRISGNKKSLESVLCQISKGEHVVSWTYKKDSYEKGGSDCGWVELQPSPEMATLKSLFPDSCVGISRVLIHDVSELPNSFFAGCEKPIEIVFSSMDAPKVNGMEFMAMPKNSLALVKRDSRGWGVDIPGVWKGINIDYATYDVRLDAEGGIVIVSTVVVDMGDPYGELPIPTRKGYAFDGWYTAREGGIKVLASDIPTEDMTLYAHWTIIPYTITYSELHGASNPNPAKYTVEDSVSFDALGNLPGRKFVGWSPDNIPLGSVGDIIVTALWQDMGVDNVLGETASTGGDADWFVSWDGANPILRSGAIVKKQSSWTEMPFEDAARVSFEWKASCEDLGGAFERTDGMTVEIDGVEAGFICGETGWIAETNLVSGEGTHKIRWTYAKDAKTDVGEDCAWVRNITVTPLRSASFDVGGAEVGVAPEPIFAYVGDRYVLPDNGTLKKAKHAFVGWRVGDDVLAAGTWCVMPTNNVIYTAVWSAKVLDAPCITAPVVYDEESALVSISAAEGTTIYYTLDGSVPSANNGTRYMGAFRVTGMAKVSAVAVLDDWYDSVVAQVVTTRSWTTLEDSLGVDDAEFTITTGGSANWIGDRANACVKSTGDGWLNAAFVGPCVVAWEERTGAGDWSAKRQVFAEEGVKEIIWEGASLSVRGLQRLAVRRVDFASGESTSGEVPQGTCPVSIYDAAGFPFELPSADGLSVPKHRFEGWKLGEAVFAVRSQCVMPDYDITYVGIWEAKKLSAPVIDAASQYSTEKTIFSVSQQEGANVYYTLDGSNPSSEHGLLYTGVVEIEGSVTIRAIAVCDDWFTSEVSSASTVRLPWSASECLNAVDLMFEFGGDADWKRDLQESHDGVASMQSGAIGNYQKSEVRTTVTGSGELSFWCRTSSECDESDGEPYDGLMVYVDDVAQGDLMGGNIQWANVCLKVSGNGDHTVRWVYEKDKSGSGGKDCVWLDEIVWKSMLNPAIEGDEGATVTGDAETGFVIKPSAGNTMVEVTIPQGVDAAKVTVEVTPKVATVKPNGAKVKVVVGDNDITGYLVIPESDGVMNIAAATVKEEIVKETLDPSKDAVIELNAANPRLITAPTRKGLTYTLFEGHALESLSKGDSKLGDGNSWKPTITVSGGDAGFYSIDVSK